jgi:hypothetical protein
MSASCNDLAGTLRPVMTSLGFFQPLQLATDIDEHLGKLGAASSARMTRSLAAITSSRKDAAPFKAEVGLMRRAKLRLRRTVLGVARSTSAVEAPNEDAKLARHPGEPPR